MRLLQASLLAAALLGSACASAPVGDIKTQAQVDPDAEFSAYKQYAWLGGAGVLNDPANLWTPRDLDVGAEVKAVIDAELSTHGLKESEEPDVFVAFVLINDVVELQRIKDDRGSNVPELVGVGQGALLVEFVDAKSGRSVWIGAATAETRTDYTDKESLARLKYAVQEIFKKLPR